MEPTLTKPENLDDCNKIAFCFTCFYFEEKLKLKIPEKENPENMCPKKREFKTGINPIFFLSYDPPI